MTEAQSIRPRDRDAVIQALRAGVTPSRGQHLIQVGRAQEIAALMQDLDRVGDGGSMFRLVIGEYGAGKTFFLHLIRSIAMEKRMVTVHADLTPDRRLHATGGQARALYAELMRNMSTRAKPDGGALPNVVERFVTSALSEARTRRVSAEAVIYERLETLTEQVGGYDFAQVVAAYWRGHDTGDEQLKSSAIRWLRGEFATRTEARQALGVRTIIDDASVYDFLKLLAHFVRLAGYTGLIVCLDEMVNLYKMANTQARRANYEQILRMLNDNIQGISAGIGFLLSGTPDFLLDTRRGLYSYEALESRLAENRFASQGLVDFTGPVLRLSNLTPEDFYVLLTKIRHVYAYGNPEAYLLPDEAITAFMGYCSQRIGDAYFRTPRTTVKAFVDLLAVLEQNPGVDWRQLLPTVEIAPDTEPDWRTPEDSADEAGGSNEDEDLVSFKL